jgi:hypothetical protein
MWMETLDWSYVGREHDRIQLHANLERGWRDLEKPGKKNSYWGFDESIRAEYRMSAYFRCRLYVVALAPRSWPGVQDAPTAIFNGKLGSNSISINSSTMVVDIPLMQPWSLSKQGRPLVYEMSDRLFQATTPEGIVNYRVQLWVVYHGEESMFAKSEYEWGDGFAWIGGRPESNRRKF